VRLKSPELLLPWPPLPGTPAWKLERGCPGTEHPSEGPAPPLPGSALGHPGTWGGWAAGWLWGVLWGCSISRQALRQPGASQTGRTPRAALCPVCPLAALPLLRKSQAVNPTSRAELLGCVSHHPARDASPRRDCHCCHQPPSAGLKDTRSRSAKAEQINMLSSLFPYAQAQILPGMPS